ncbi:hypothetical protein PQJ75_12735 [Rhodoplanes sp. TEM]|uniref:Methyltransferase domain-containing protein n=1 Tax=Rhodoplanes tepidamans TaxID=200616 RepID=A0ABT5JEK6_RHOTP|nr:MULTISPECIES: hypothetical protein [Rhodoplanes]MDC7788115.1 hypothetical protein [Rhodoplanes tepidamans]MDC7984597.1 hypothetical protein [Rhodoplanes sp. TEM]MDQ0355594.1 hypothetical protein [Rhodoplanes tepidamans]
MPSLETRPPSDKQLRLLDAYAAMARDGYARTDGSHVAAAYDDMEIRAFKFPVRALIARHGAKTLLDWGCGGSDWETETFHEEQSAKHFFGLDAVYRYEPARGIDERQPCDAVVCFDVLEHVFVADVPATVRALFAHAGRLLMVNVACYPARALLPNGENAHVTQRPPHWWKGVFDAIASEFPDVTVQLWCSTAWRAVHSWPPVAARDWLARDGFTVAL